MTRTLLLSLIAAAALAGCNSNKDDHTIIAGPDGDQANAPESNGPVTLPPSIAASKIYRCKDNSVVYIDWLSDQKSANFRGGQNEPAVQLVAPEPGQPLVAEGYSLTGTADGSTVNLTRPSKGSQSCKA